MVRQFEFYDKDMTLVGKSYCSSVEYAWTAARTHNQSSNPISREMIYLKDFAYSKLYAISELNRKFLGKVTR